MWATGALPKHSPVASSSTSRRAFPRTSNERAIGGQEGRLGSPPLAPGVGCARPMALLRAFGARTRRVPAGALAALLRTTSTQQHLSVATLSPPHPAAQQVPTRCATLGPRILVPTYGPGVMTAHAEHHDLPLGSTPELVSSGRYLGHLQVSTPCGAPHGPRPEQEALSG